MVSISLAAGADETANALGNSKKMFIVTGLLLLVVGGGGIAVWYFFFRGPPHTPASPSATPFDRGGNWKCMAGIKGRSTPVPVNLCQHGELCQQADGSQGVCVSNKKPQSPSSEIILGAPSRGPGEETSFSCQPFTKADDAQKCADACWEDGVSAYAVYNKQSGACLCRRQYADAAFDQCIMPSPAQAWQTCLDTSQKDGRSDPCDTTSAHRVTGYSWGSAQGVTEKLYNLTKDECAADIIKRGQNTTFGVHHADSPESDTGTCYVKSRNPPADVDNFQSGEDPFWDCTYGNPWDKGGWGTKTNIDLEHDKMSLDNSPMCLPELLPVKIKGDLGKNAWFRPTSIQPDDAWLNLGHMKVQSTHDCAVACGNIRFRNNDEALSDNNNRAAIVGHSNNVPMSQPMSRYDAGTQICHCYDYIKSRSEAFPQTGSENDEVLHGEDFFRCAPKGDDETEKTAWVRTSIYTDVVSPFDVALDKLTDIPSCDANVKTNQNPGQITERCDDDGKDDCKSGWGKFISNPFDKQLKMDGNKNCLCLPNLSGEEVGNCDWKNPMVCQRRQLPIWWDLYNADGDSFALSESCLTRKSVELRGRPGKRCGSYRQVLGNPCAYDDDCETGFCRQGKAQDQRLGQYCQCPKEEYRNTCGTPLHPDP